jgi:hypothetical protein
LDEWFEGQDGDAANEDGLRQALAEVKSLAARYDDYALCLEVGVALADEELSAWALAGALINMRSMQAGEDTADRLERVLRKRGVRADPWVADVLNGLRNPLQ